MELRRDNDNSLRNEAKREKKGAAYGKDGNSRKDQAEIWKYSGKRKQGIIFNDASRIGTDFCSVISAVIWNADCVSGLFPGAPILSERTKWVGLKYFKQFIEGRYFGRLLKNTLYLSFLNLVFGFPIPIIFSLLLNEVKNVKFKKFAQTASYLPYFISMVVVAGIVLSFIGTDGIINDIRGLFGKEPVAYNVNTSAFPVIYTVTNIWKTFGWNSILYLSSMSSIDTALYESARIDGANRLQRAIYITLPGIMPTIAIMFIMGVGGIMASNTDLILLLYNPTIYETSDVFGTYIYRDGITNGNFSLNSAVGIISSTINFLLIFIANKLSVKCTGNGMW